MLRADKNFFIPYSIKLNIGIRLDTIIGRLNVKEACFPNGECSIMVVRATVARKKRVRFSPFALKRQRKIDSALASQGSAKRVRFSPFALTTNDCVDLESERTTRLKKRGNKMNRQKNKIFSSFVLEEEVQ